MKIKKKNYFGLNIKKAEKELKAKYLNDVCLKDADGNWINVPVALFYSKNPDVSKGHKHFPFIIYRDSDSVVIGAFDELLDEIRYVNAIHCPECDEVIYSSYRHDFVECKCKQCFIDGGRDYFRRGDKGKHVILDLFKNKIIKE